MGKRYSHKIVIIILVTLFGCHRDISFFPTTSYYREKDFIQTINKKNPDNIKIELTDENIFPVSGTVSHHLLVGSITNQWFKELKKLRDIKTFIILTPNHYNQGKEIISLSKKSWLTNNGIVKVNKKYVYTILTNLKLKEDDNAFHNEHGIGDIVPFIKLYFPKADIVPISFDQFNKRIKKCNDLATQLSTIIKKNRNVFILVSTDFSHRADIQTTLSRDLYSEKVINSFDPVKVNTIHSDNTAGLITLFFTLNEVGVYKTHIFSNTNAKNFDIKTPDDDITSYFFTYQY